MAQLPIPTPDYFSPASYTDRLKFVATLLLLPQRELLTVDAKKTLHGLLMCTIEGVSTWALEVSLRRIIGGDLGHAFCPSFSEVRPFIDREVMRPVYEQQRRERMVAEQMEERRRIEAVHASQTPESKERVAARVDRLQRERDETDKERRRREEAAERAAHAAAMARYGITASTLKAIPDAPLPAGMHAIGAAPGVLFLPSPDEPVAAAEPTDEQKRNGLDIEDGQIGITMALTRRMKFREAVVVGESTRSSPLYSPDRSDAAFRRLNERRRKQGKKAIQPASSWTTLPETVR